MFFDSIIFDIIPIFFTIFFIIFIGALTYNIYTAIKTKRTNDNSPRLKVSANIVDKRNHITHYNTNNNMHTSYTNYYVTFEFESGDRLELEVDSNDYGYLVVGDYGDLEFQGTRFLSFTRY